VALTETQVEVLGNLTEMVMKTQQYLRHPMATKQDRATYDLLRMCIGMMEQAFENDLPTGMFGRRINGLCEAVLEQHWHEED
jgi:hypothetical protein